MASASNVTPIQDLKHKRARLTSSERKIVRRCIDAIEEMVIDALPELISGVNVSGKQSSITTTTTLKKAKGQNLNVVVAPRVRAPREAFEFQAHITDSKQLELGWVEVEGEDEDLSGDFSDRNDASSKTGDDTLEDR